MYLCKNICLVENCNCCPAYFANYSRFHFICTQHLDHNNQTQDQKCRVCENYIKIVKNSELSLPSRILPCLEPECNLKPRDFLCNHHRLCDSHNTIKDFIYCNLCICSKCKREGAYIKANMNNYCSDCYFKHSVCVYCNNKATDNFFECEHFYCSEHNYPDYFCKCQVCKTCQVGVAKRKSCFHNNECNCVYKQLCLNCIINLGIRN